MAHPSNALPNTTYVIDANAVDVQATPKSGTFHSISCSVGGTVTVTGGGVYIYVDVSVATDVHTGFIDPATGVVFEDDATMNTAGDGFYESVSTTARNIVMIAGQNIYGKFDSVKSDGTFTGFAYT